MNACRSGPNIGDRERQLDDERCALSLAGALCDHAAAVQLDEVLDQRQPEPEP